MEVLHILRFKDLREDKDKLQKDIALLLKVTQPQYSRIELGINQASYEQLTILANFYNTSTDYMLGLTNIKKPYPKNIERK